MNSAMMTRRDALRLGGGTATALAIGFVLPLPAGGPARAAGDGATLNGWVKVLADGTVEIGLSQAEMGQGVYNSLPQIIADELDARFEDIRVVNTPIAAQYRFLEFIPEMFTAGSTSVRTGMGILRKAGASAREVLVEAAAMRLNVDVGELSTSKGKVIHAASGRSIGYGELVAEAATLKPSEEPRLKDPSQFAYIGKPMKRFDVEDKVTGRAVYASDVRLPDMLVATISTAPVHGGMLRTFDRDAALAVKGVVDIIDIPSTIATVNGFAIPFPPALAVVADTFWHAKKGLEAAAPVFSDAGLRHVDDVWIDRTYREALDRESLSVAKDEGGALDILAGSSQVVSVDYAVPYLAHAAMEPMSAVARVSGNTAEIWAGTQGIEFHQRVLHDLLKIPQENIAIHNVFLGGGFGRRYEPDFVAQAALIAQRLNGRPVKLIWSREEDIQHDFYRPAYRARFRAALDDNGMPKALHAHIVGQSVFRHSPGFAGFIGDNGVDGAAIEGLPDMPYAIPALKVDYTEQNVHIPVGWWRSVGNSQNAFFRETFIDRLARKAGADPIAYRKALLKEQPVYRGVIDELARMSKWGDPPKGRHQGVAIQHVFGSIVGQVAEIVLDGDRLRVEKVYVAIDCGQAINPDGIEAQLRGAVIYGLSAALAGKINIDKGAVAQSNFHDFQVLQMSNTPLIETSVRESGGFIGGLGEAATAQIAPAIANAILAASGKEINALPFSTQFNV